MVTEEVVAQDGVVIVAEVISEVTIAEVVVMVAKVVIDRAVTKGAFAEGNMARVARDLSSTGTSSGGKKAQRKIHP